MQTDAEQARDAYASLKAAVAARQADDVVRHARELLCSNKAADTMFCASAFKCDRQGVGGCRLQAKLNDVHRSVGDG
jgi:hypothetical protein